MITNRYNDHNGERIVHQFLVEYFYNTLGKIKEPTDDEQIQGVDAYFTFDKADKYYIVDEKIQLTKINTPITQYTTQCLEIMSKIRNSSESYARGWFTRNNMTEYYLFTYITKSTANNQNDLSVDSIEEVEAIFISKNRIKQMLHENGIGTINLMHFAYLMINNKVHNRTNEDKIYYDFNRQTRDMYLCHSTRLGESPVNCIIRWNTYKQYAEYVFKITKKNVTILSKRK